MISKRDVGTFINVLRELVNNERFDIDSDFIFINSSKNEEDYQYSTRFTLLDLEYDAYDVLDKLLELRVEEYSESVLDKDNNDPLWLHVFGKKINNRLIYLKLKIRSSGNKQIVCVSFHYAKNNMSFPYC